MRTFDACMCACDGTVNNERKGIRKCCASPRITTRYAKNVTYFHGCRRCALSCIGHGQTNKVFATAVPPARPRTVPFSRREGGVRRLNPPGGARACARALHFVH